MLRWAFACPLVAAAACAAFGSSSGDSTTPVDAGTGTALGDAAAPAAVEGDAGSAADGPCADAGTHRLMFVTQDLFTGNLGGQAGAARLCTSAAADAGLSGSYVAWLSTSTTAPGPNLARRPNVPLLLPNCERLAADLDHLTTLPGIEAAPDVTERGLRLASASCDVWTSTRANGEPGGGATCGDWTAAAPSDSALVGECGDGPDSGSPDSWTAKAGTYVYCNAVARLYCIEN